jgi:PAS domain S-box-containing protein
MTKTAQYVAAVFGRGPLARDLLAAFGSEATPELREMIRIAGVVSRVDHDLVPADYRVFDDAAELIRHEPEVNLALIAEEGCAVDGICRDLPPDTAIINGEACRFVLDLADPAKVCAACKVDLAHARSLFAAIIDQVREDILLLDSEGRIIDANRNVYERRNKTKEDYVGFYVWEALDEEESLCRPPEYDCPLSKTLADGVAAEAVYNRVDEQGRMQYYRVYTYPVLNDEGVLTNVFEIRRDITRRTFMEQRLQQSEKLAAVGELSTYLAHEIRNPLFAISGFANSLLRNDSLDDAAREKVSIVLEESKRLDTILKAILNFARPTEATARTDVDLNAIVRETMDVMRYPCEMQHIRVHLELQEDLALATGDPELLKQCLINLVKNASEAMPEGGDLTVRTAMTKDAVTLAVQDTGTGIPEENRPKVFNPFFSTKDQGSGLGLAMIKKIIDDIGGDVALESQTGMGTTVTLSLPPVMALSGEETAETTTE